jgi:alpha-methylacyl-CoA racemase
VLDLAEAPEHPHNRARGTFYAEAGGVLPMPAPRFDRTPPAIPTPSSRPGADTVTGLAAWGFGEGEIEALCETGVAFATQPAAG